MSKPPKTPRGSWCVECGPNVGVDEDGCCAACGSTATGPYADAALALLELAEQSVAKHTADPDHDAEVLALCRRIGFGAVMSSAARQWRELDPLGAFTIGHCVGTVVKVLAKARGGR